MNKHFRRLSIVMAVMMVFVCSFSCVFADAAADVDLFKDIHSDDIVILHTNDVHCGIDGYPYLAAYRDDVAKLASKVILADCGDATQGDAVGTLSHGEYLIDIMNEMKYDVVVPGNHEFDYGFEQFLKNMKAHKAKVLCANLMDLKTGEPLFDGYTIITAGDKKIAFVGVDTPESISKSTPTYFMDADGNYLYGFCQDKDGTALYTQVQKVLDAALAENPDYVIGIMHCGDDLASQPWTSTEIVANTHGFTAVLDGHSHSTVQGKVLKDKDGHEVVIAQTGTKLANIGQLVIHGDGTIASSLIAVGADAAYNKTDAAMSKFIKGINDKNSELLAKKIGKSEVTLTVSDWQGKRAVRSYETNAGDFCADAYKTVLGADIAFVNGGGIRADIPTGDITYGQVIKVHPYNNMGCLIETNGQDILDALEFAYRGTPNEEVGGFLQVAGLTCTVNTTIPSPVVMDTEKMFVKVDGPRRVSNVMVNGKPIDPKGTYKLASHNYMLKDCGDGFTMFKDDTVLLDCVMLDNEVLIKYVESLGGTIPATYAEPQGRITITSPLTDAQNKWYSQYVDYSYQNGLIKGMTDTTFAPTNTMTKEQFLTVLARMDKVDGTVEEGTYWATPYVEWAQKNNICEAEGFDGKANITREEMSEYIYNFYVYLGKGPVGAWAIRLDYTDLADVADPTAIMFNTMKGFFEGNPDGTFLPNNTAKRQEAVKVLVLVHQDLF